MASTSCGSGRRTGCRTRSSSPSASSIRSPRRRTTASFEAAQSIPSPCVVEGTSAGADVDYFRFPGKKGQRIVVDAQCARIGSGVDPQLRLMRADASHKYIASADDTAGLLTDARIVADLPEEGDYVIELSDTRYQGGGRPVYRLVVGALPVADEVYPLGGRRGEATGFELRGGTIGEARLGVARAEAPAGLEVFHARFTGPMLGLGPRLGHRVGADAGRRRLSRGPRAGRPQGPADPGHAARRPERTD